MPDERAFTRRQAGVNPIALELERLAEQQALQTLGYVPARTMLPRSEDLTASTAPAATPEEIAVEERSSIPRPEDAWVDIAPATPEEIARHTRFLNRMHRQGVAFDPTDPRWGGREEDEAYDWLYAMRPRERRAFVRTFRPR